MGTKMERYRCVGEVRGEVRCDRCLERCGKTRQVCGEERRGKVAWNWYRKRDEREKKERVHVLRWNRKVWKGVWRRGNGIGIKKKEREMGEEKESR